MVVRHDIASFPGSVTLLQMGKSMRLGMYTLVYTVLASFPGSSEREMYTREEPGIFST